MKSSQNVHGNSKREVKDPRKYISIERHRYIVKDVEVLDSWYYPGEWNDWVEIAGHKEWILRRDAVHHEIYPHWSLDKTFSKKYRINNIEVPG